MGKAMNKTEIKALLGRHDKIALQFSGGKDSLACYHLLKPYLNQIVVYWLNTGDAFPETLAVIEQIKAETPHFIEITSNAQQCRGEFGNPVDILPRSSTPIGLSSGQSHYLMQDSYSCCARVIMAPLHQRMLDDGITLIIRGQKDADSHKAPFQSGFIDNGIEYFFPLENWRDEDVFTYLVEHDIALPRFYTLIDSTLDCMGCTGWWRDHRATYLSVHHPELYHQYRDKMAIIQDEIEQHIVNFNAEVGG